MGRKPRRFGQTSDGMLNITSLMDAFTIILVFLLKQMDSEGNLLTAADNLKLPNSTSRKTPTEVNLSVTVDEKQILVDATPSANTEDVAKQDSLIVAGMVPILEEKRDLEKKLALAKGEEPDESGSVIVQMDKNLQYDVMYKVMATCGWSGFNNVSFAVISKFTEE